MFCLMSASKRPVVDGLLCGAPNVTTTWRRPGPFNEYKRKAVGLTWRDQSARLATPGYDAINAQ
jgi:hypothetical protein